MAKNNMVGTALHAASFGMGATQMVLDKKVGIVNALIRGLRGNLWQCSAGGVFLRVSTD